MFKHRSIITTKVNPNMSMPDSMCITSPSQESMFTWLLENPRVEQSIDCDNMPICTRSVGPASTLRSVQTDVKRPGQVWGKSDRSDPFRFACNSLMTQ